MEGPFFHIRNKYSKTPLERIVDTIESAKKQVSQEEKNFNYIMESEEKNKLKLIIEDLK